MKIFPWLLFCIYLPFSSFPQKVSEIIYEHQKNNIHPRIDTIDYENFNRIRKIGISTGPHYQSIYLPDEINRKADSLWKSISLNRIKDSLHVDSIIRSLKAKYSSSIYENDTNLILNGNDKIITLCKRNGSDEKYWSSYEFKDYQNDYIVIANYGYEQWEYIVFNPETRNYGYLEHYPYFLNDSIVYCSENYYGEGGFQVMQLTGNHYFGFESYGWQLEECYRLNKTFYFSFRSNKDPSNKPKYIKINLNNYF